MALQLQILAGTIVDSADVGSVSWVNPDNAKVSDGVYATVNLSGIDPAQDNSIKIVKGGTIQGTDQSTGAFYTGISTYKSFGSSSNLWGLSWTSADINDSTFGVVISAKDSGTSHYLKATNFGFSIPTGATINGILVEVQRLYSGGSGQVANIDHIRITVYYTNEVGYGVISPFPCHNPDGRFSMDGSGSSQ